MEKKRVAFIAAGITKFGKREPTFKDMIPSGFNSRLVYAVLDFDNGVRIVNPLIETDSNEMEVGNEVVLKVVDAPHNRVLLLFNIILKRLSKT